MPDINFDSFTSAFVQYGNCADCGTMISRPDRDDAVWVSSEEMNDAYNMNREREYEHPYVGQPATVNLYTDSYAAVVVKVNPKSVVVRSVATDPSTAHQVNIGESLPCIIENGVLTSVIGTPERFNRVVTSRGVRYRRGSINLTLGHSYSCTDYRY